MLRIRSLPQLMCGGGNKPLEIISGLGGRINCRRACTLQRPSFSSSSSPSNLLSSSSSPLSSSSSPRNRAVSAARRLANRRRRKEEALRVIREKSNVQRDPEVRNRIVYAAFGMTTLFVGWGVLVEDSLPNK